MYESFGAGGAEATSVDGDGAALDAICALGVGDEVFSLDEDFAVSANRDGAVADAESEGLAGFDEQLVRYTRNSVLHDRRLQCPHDHAFSPHRVYPNEDRTANGWNLCARS